MLTPDDSAITSSQSQSDYVGRHLVNLTPPRHGQGVYGQPPGEGSEIKSYGGINLKDIENTLELKRASNGRPYPIEFQPLDLNQRIRGFYPIIDYMHPVRLIPQLGHLYKQFEGSIAASASGEDNQPSRGQEMPSAKSLSSITLGLRRE